VAIWGAGLQKIGKDRLELLTRFFWVGGMGRFTMSPSFIGDFKAMLSVSGVSMSSDSLPRHMSAGKSKNYAYN
jgi:hypothetical protein